MGSVVRETALLADIMAARRVYETLELPSEQAQRAELSRLNSILEAVSQRKEVYDQLRYLDMQGNEVIRINFNGGHSEVVPKKELQNKAKRYYFQKPLNLDAVKSMYLLWT